MRGCVWVPMTAGCGKAGGTRKGLLGAASGRGVGGGGAVRRPGHGGRAGETLESAIAAPCRVLQAGWGRGGARGKTVGQGEAEVGRGTQDTRHKCQVPSTKYQVPGSRLRVFFFLYSTLYAYPIDPVHCAGVDRAAVHCVTV